LKFGVQVEAAAVVLHLQPLLLGAVAPAAVVVPITCECIKQQMLALLLPSQLVQVAPAADLQLLVVMEEILHLVHF